MFLHIDDTTTVYVEGEVRCHYCSVSQAYAGGDALVSALQDGWRVAGTVEHREVWYGGGRQTAVYGFTLRRDGEKRVMQIVSNPYVLRLLRSSRLKIVSVK